jgi:branched-chain amino acid transport system permease protein
MALYVQFLLAGLTLGGIYSVIALGFTLIFKVSSVMNFAHGDIVMIVALVGISFLAVTHLSVVLVFPVMVVLGAGVTLLIYVLFIRPVLRRSLMAGTVITLGVSFVLQGVGLVGWGPFPLVIRLFLSKVPVVVLGATVSRQAILAMVFSLIVAAVFWVFLEKTLLGKALRACDEDVYGAELCGVVPTHKGTLPLGGIRQLFQGGF